MYIISFKKHIIFIIFIISIQYIYGAWYSNGWMYKKKITIDPNIISGELTNFPWLVAINSDPYISSHAQSDGDDILFTLSDGTNKIPHEIESYSNGTIYAWVKIPLLSASSNTNIFIYYGKLSSANMSDPTNVWDTYFGGVWHLEETSGFHDDSTSNGNTGHPSNNVTQGTQGVAGRCIYLDGTDDTLVECGFDSSICAGSAGFNFSMWVNYTNTVVKWVGGKGDTAGAGKRYQIVVESADDEIAFKCDDSVDTIQAKASTVFCTNGEWHFFSGVRDTSSNRLYVDGIEIAASNNSALDDIDEPTAPLFIGSMNNTGDPDAEFQGFIDEVRFAKTARSAEWIKTEYTNMILGVNAITLGSEITILPVLACTNPLPGTWIVTETQGVAGWASNVGAAITGIFFSTNGIDYGAVTIISGNGMSNWFTNIDASPYDGSSVVFYIIASNDIGITVTNIQTNYVSIFPEEEATNWYNNDWNYRKLLTIDPGMVFGTLTNFPWLFAITNDTDLEDHAQQSGNDILFTLDDGKTKLYHEIESFTNGDLYAWVKIPLLSGTTNTNIYMYYGNSAALDQSEKTNVWSNYIGVWHFNEKTGNMKDSTTNNNDGIPINTPNLDGEGMIAGGVDFNSNNFECISMGDRPEYEITGPVSFSCWGKFKEVALQSNEGMRLIGKGTDPGGIGYGYTITEFEVFASGRKVYFERWGPNNDDRNYAVAHDPGITSNEWYHFYATWDGTTSPASQWLYINGQVKATNSSGNKSPTLFDTNEFRTGCDDKNTHPLNGYIDEVRVSDRFTPLNWIMTEFTNQALQSAGSLYTPQMLSINLASNANGTFNSAIIQDVITNAADGDTIYVYPGVYVQNVTIASKNDIKLFSLSYEQTGDKESVIIRGSEAAHTIMISNASSNIIRGFTIQNGSRTGVLITDSAKENSIEENIICLNGDHSVRVIGDGCDGNVLIKNKIYNSYNPAHGCVSVEEADFTEINSNIIHNSPGYGIYFGSGSMSNRVMSNTIKSNAKYGLLLDEGEGTEVLFNTIQDNNTGIRYTDPSTLCVQMNNINNNTGFEFENVNAPVLSLQSNYWGGSDVSYAFVKAEISNISMNDYVPYRFFPLYFDICNIWPSAIPANVTGSSNIKNKIIIDWSDVPGASSYMLYRSINTNTWTNFTVSYKNVGNSICTDNSVSLYTNYYYFITVMDSTVPFANESWFSASAFGKVYDSPYVYLTNYSSNALVYGSITLAGVVTNTVWPLSKLFFTTNNTGYFPIALQGNSNTNWYTNNFNTALLPDGTNYFTFYIVDSINMTNSNTYPLVVVNTPPFIGITNVTNGEVIGGSSFIIAGTNNTGFAQIVTNILFTNNAYYAGTNAGPWSFSIDTTLINDGEIVFAVIASNEIGFISANTWTNYISNLPPVIQSTDPKPGTWINEEICKFIGYASNLGGGSITGVYFSTNGIEYGLVQGTESWSTNIDVGPYDGKTHVFYFIASNDAGFTATNIQTNFISILTDFPAEDWYSPAWKYRKEISIDPDAVFGTLTNFPYLVVITNDSDLIANAQGSGGDILFTLGNGITKLKHELEYYSSGDLYAWVRIPVLSASTNTNIMMYYGNSGAFVQSEATNVWDEHYRGVWHFNETAGSCMDSTSNGIVGSLVNAPSLNTDGMIRSGIEFFSNNNSYVNMGNTAKLGISDAITLSSWVNFKTLPCPNGICDLGQMIICRGDGGVGNGTGYYFDLFDSSGVPGRTFEFSRFKDSDGSRMQVLQKTNITNEMWYYVTTTWQGTNGGVQSIYIDGELLNSGIFADATKTSTVNFLLGYSFYTSRYPLNAFLDEVRVSAYCRSADWIKTEYSNQCIKLNGPDYTQEMPYSNFVSNATSTFTSSNIQTVLDSAVNGDLIFVFAGIYDEEVIISNLNGITLVSMPYEKEQNRKGAIIRGSSAENTLHISNGNSNTVKGFYIQNGNNAGVLIKGISAYNKISENIICNSGDYCIKIEGNFSDSNSIISNEIYKNFNSNYGCVYIWNADNTKILDNKIYESAGYGICIEAISANTMISNNSISSNAGKGVYIESAGADYTYLYENVFDSNETGIHINIGAEIIDIISNTVINNTTGLDINEGNGIAVECNIITNNTIGLRYDDTDELQAKMNNFTNTEHSIVNVQGNNINIISNYWWSIDLTQIISFVTNVPSNYAPYRLSYIGIGVNEIWPPDIPASVDASTNANGKIIISWDDMSASGAVGYRIYRNDSTNSWSNFTSYYAEAGVSVFTDTNIMLYSNYYYYITSYDSASPYSNESWFSSYDRGYTFNLPYMEVTNITNGEIIAGKFIKIAGTNYDADSFVKGNFLHTNNVFYTNVTNTIDNYTNFSIDLDTTKFSNGEIVLTMIASNDIGGIFSNTQTNYISNLPPVLTFTNPSAGEWINTNIFEFSGWSSNAYTVTNETAAVYFSTDGTNFGGMTLLAGGDVQTADWQTNVDVVPFEGSTHAFYIIGSNYNGDVVTNIQSNYINIEKPEIIHAWYDTNWYHRKSIEIDPGMVHGVLTNFPWLVAMTNDADLALCVKANGEDILFTLGDGTNVMPHQIESYDNTVGSLFAWVKIPLLSKNINTKLFMYYSNAAASGLEDPTNVWDEDYAMVLHMDETNPLPQDSTSNGRHVTANQTSPEPLYDTNGLINGSTYYYEGVPASYSHDCVAHDNVFETGPFSMETWVIFNDYADDGYVYFFQKRSDGTDNVWSVWNLVLDRWATNGNNYTNKISWNYMVSPDTNTNMYWIHSDEPVEKDGRPYHIAIRLDSASNMTLFVNGRLQKETANLPSRYLGNQDLYIGGQIAGVMIDEVRWSSTVRSSNWIATSYTNQLLSTGGNIYSTEHVHIPLMNIASNTNSGDTSPVIQDVMNNAADGDTIHVYPGVYDQDVLIDLNNISLISLPYLMSDDRNEVVIRGSGAENTITISNGDNNTVQGFTIQNGSSAGVLIQAGANGNIISDNIICFSGDCNICIEGGTTDSNKVLRNIIYNNYNTNFGSVYINNADNNIIQENEIYRSSGYGIGLDGTAINTVISNNRIYSNATSGVYINNTGADSTKIYDNMIFSNISGIFIEAGASTGDIIGNVIYQNVYGMKIHEGSGAVISLNAITNNATGIYYDDLSSCSIKMNNVNANSFAFNNVQSISLTLTSNYWGSLNFMEVSNSISNTVTNNYMPYRLGYIGIKQSGVWPAAVPASLSSTSNLQNMVIIDWANSADAAGYRIYRSTGLDTWTNFNSYYAESSVSIYTDTNAELYSNYYYYITAYDSASPYENESWFSSSIFGAAYDYPSVSITNLTNDALINGSITLAGVVTNTVWPLQELFFTTNGGGYLSIELFANTTTNWYTNNFNTASLPDGTNVFTFIVVDTISMSNSNEVRFIIDNSPPQAFITNVTNNEVIAGSGFSVAGTNNEKYSYVVRNMLYTNNSLYSNITHTPGNDRNFTFIIDTTFMSNGELTFVLITTNSVGLGSTNEWTNYVSNAAPVVSILYPDIASPTWLTNSPAIITGYVTSTYGAVKILQFRTNGGIWSDCITDPPNLTATNVLTADFYTNFSVLPHTNTNVIWQIRVENEYAIDVTNIYTNRVDLSPPVVNFNPVIENGLLSAVTNIKGNAAEVYDTIDGGYLVFMTNSVVRYNYPVFIANNMWSNVINTANMQDDIYDVYVYITNNAKLVTVVTQTNVLVSNDTGLFIHVSPADGGFITGAPVTLTGYIDAGSFAVSNAYFMTNGGIWAKLNLAVDKTNWWTNIETTNYADGSNAFWFMCIDDNDNTNHFHSNWYVVDNSPPRVGITNLWEGDYISSTFTFKGTNKDPHSGILGTRIYITNTINSTIITNKSKQISFGRFTNIWESTNVADGRYYVYAETTNNAGLFTNTVSIMFIVNNEDPIIIETNLGEYRTNAGEVLFAGVASNVYSGIDPMKELFLRTNSGISAYPVILSGLSWWTNIETASGYSDGTNLFSFTAVNSNSLSNTYTVTNIIDNSPPMTGYTNVSNGAVISGSFFPIAGTNTENWSYVIENILLTNGSVYSNKTYTGVKENTWSFTIDTVSLSNGEIEFGIAVINSIGLTSTQYWTNYISNVAPDIAITNPQGNTWLTNQLVSFSGWASNMGALIMGVYFSTNGSEYGLVSGTTNWETNNVDISSFEDSTNIFWVCASNVYANLRYTSITCYIDFTPPALSITNPADKSTIAGTVSYTGTNYDSFAPVTGFYYSITNSSWIQTNIQPNFSITLDTRDYNEGTFIFGIRSSNEAGLVASNFITNYITNRGIFGEITNVTNWMWLTNRYIDFAGRAYDTAGDVTGVYFSTNGSTFGSVTGTTNWYTNSIDMIGMTDSSNVFYIIASNEFGYGRTNSVVCKIDLTPPHISILSPAAGNTIVGKVLYSGSNWDDYSAISSFSYSTNSGSNWIDTNVATYWSFDINTTAFSNGAFVFGIRSINEVGHYTNMFITNYITNMKIFCTNPLETKYLSSNVTFKGYLGEGGLNISNMIMHVDGSNFDISKNTLPLWSVIYNTELLIPDGEYDFNFIVIDSNGTTNDENLYTFKIDNTEPTAKVMDTNREFLGEMEVIIDGEDNYSQIEKIVYTVDETEPVISSASIPDRGAILITNTTVIYYKAVDRAGNISSNNIVLLTRIPNDPYEKYAIGNIDPIPFTPLTEKLTIEVFKQDSDITVRVFIFDLFGNVQAVVNDLSPHLYKGHFEYEGMNMKGKKLGRGMYYIMLEVDGKVERKIIRKMYVDY
ncbi:DUF2341 domain-containing protein [Spirochaetota bacterium]